MKTSGVALTQVSKLVRANVLSPETKLGGTYRGTIRTDHRILPARSEKSLLRAMSIMYVRCVPGSDTLLYT